LLIEFEVELVDQALAGPVHLGHEFRAVLECDRDAQRVHGVGDPAVEIDLILLGQDAAVRVPVVQVVRLDGVEALVLAHLEALVEDAGQHGA
jgi:hypothetical protein